MTDQTPAHGCTINGQPAMPILISEYNQLTAELAALRAVARGYCPACGRGDAAPTLADWEQQKQRADQAETALTAAQRAARGVGAWGVLQAADKTLQQQPSHRFTARPVDPEMERIATERAEQAAAKHERAAEQLAAISAPYTGLVIQPYRNDRGDNVWVFRCWGSDTCDGWLSLDHHTEQSAQRARDRHVAEEHAEPAPEATGHVYLSTGCLHGDHDYCKSMTGLNGSKRPGECKHCGAKCTCGCHATPAPAGTEATDSSAPPVAS